MIRRSLLAAASGLALFSPARAQVLHPVDKPYTVGEGLAGEITKKKTKPAEDISGIACAPAGAGPRTCLVVDDEATGAQFVTLDGTTLNPGAVVDIAGRKPPIAALGAPPATGDCTLGQGAYKEMDGEAVAYAAPDFYVTGSHGCSRRGREFKLSTAILARLRPNATGMGARVETTYRLGDALRTADTVGPYFLKDLEPREGGKPLAGLNVEGLAVIGDTLYAGLRAPVIDGRAFLVSVPVAPLFAPGDGPLGVKPVTIPLDLGPEAGIRDLTALPDGRLLVLSGPTRNGLSVPYGLFLAELPSGKVTSLGTLAPLDGDEVRGKPEGLVRLGPGRVLVVFDSVLNGGPREYAVAIP
ncbi:DUF3616 domain-containing protein [Methylobacterium sp. J-090]|uniref:DUF3616 domain-containing protein n=1 Tax=Methylobacterium sp. J-090 TaxID=2836666 RepID=UPI001FBBA8D3|nr:DUF3616 domain-containing protein [Methylobacterium sp. J-090]MCJ2080452.1 DUF3616 domain-containing protein [Methylobacterium sp. J-090]